LPPDPPPLWAQPQERAGKRRGRHGRGRERRLRSAREREREALPLGSGGTKIEVPPLILGEGEGGTREVEREAPPLGSCDLEGEMRMASKTLSSIYILRTCYQA
jgi:hypothetical protein